MSFGQPQRREASPGYGCEGLGPHRRSAPAGFCPIPSDLQFPEAPGAGPGAAVASSRGCGAAAGGAAAAAERSGDCPRGCPDGRAAPAASALSAGGTRRSLALSALRGMPEEPHSPLKDAVTGGEKATRGVPHQETPSNQKKKKSVTDKALRARLRIRSHGLTHPPPAHTGAFLPKLRNSRHTCRRQTSAMPICNGEGRNGGCLPAGQGRPDKGLPAAAPLRPRGPGRLLGREAPRQPSPRPRAACVEGHGRRGRGAGGGGADLTLLKCHTLMGMENVNFLCIPGTIPWGGDL